MGVGSHDNDPVVMDEPQKQHSSAVVRHDRPRLLLIAVTRQVILLGYGDDDCHAPAAVTDTTTVLNNELKNAINTKNTAAAAADVVTAAADFRTCRCDARPVSIQNSVEEAHDDGTMMAR